MKLICKIQPVIFIPYLVGACAILWVVLISSGCRQKEERNRTEGNHDSTFRSFPVDQLVVWLKPGTTASQFHHWLDSFETVNGKTHQLAMCHECDNSLMLLNGPGIKNYIQQGTAPGGPGTTGGGKPVGENGVVYYSANYVVNFSDSTLFLERKKKVIFPVKQKQPEVIVAVFDTGIDSTFFNKLYFYHFLGKSCLGGDANNGWNFSSISGNNNWGDDFLPEKHGSVVTKFIVDQVNAGDPKGNGIELLPVKTHDSTGQSNLFNVLCGFSYAAKCGVQIINASFGFYTTRSAISRAKQDSNVILLKEYVKEYLTKNNILLIAAAGNKSDMEDTPDFAKFSDNDKRNLDSVSFYPASLAEDKELPNVIAVTTVNDFIVCPTQNFSRHVVDIGAVADDAAQFYFLDPLGRPKPVKGSSFATPIVTGKICSNYHLFEKAIRKPGFVKSDIIKILIQNHLAHSNPALKNKINNGGLVMKK